MASGRATAPFQRVLQSIPFLYFSPFFLFSILSSLFSHILSFLSFYFFLFIFLPLFLSHPPLPLITNTSTNTIQGKYTRRRTQPALPSWLESEGNLENPRGNGPGSAKPLRHAPRNTTEGRGELNRNSNNSHRIYSHNERGGGERRGEKTREERRGGIKGKERKGSEVE